VRLGSDSSHPYSLRGASRPKPGPLTCCSPSSSQLQVVFGKQASAFGLREAAPDAVGPANTECEFDAVLANAALRTDVLRVLLTRLAVVATFRCRRRKEQRRFRSATSGAQMPSLVNKAECHAYSVPSIALSA